MHKNKKKSQVKKKKRRLKQARLQNEANLNAVDQKSVKVPKISAKQKH